MLRKWILALALAAGFALSIAPAAHASAVQTFANNAVTTLAAPITSTTATTLTVSSSAEFPTLSGGNWFVATLEHLVSGIVTAQEIIKVTAVSGTTWTIVRAQESTSGLTWVAGDTVALLPTAGGLAQFVQPTQAQAQSYNVGTDTGSGSNVYAVSLTPALTAHVVGMPIRFKAAHSNTGGSTFNDGAGAGAILTPSLAALQGGEIVTPGYVTVMWDGSRFQLVQEGGTALLLNPAGAYTQTITGPLNVEAAGSYVELRNTSSASNNGAWLWQTFPTGICLVAYNDSISAGSDAFCATRSGDTILSVALGGALQTGTTQPLNDNSNNFATTQYVANQFSTSPALGGSPTATTQTYTDNSTKIATDQFVQENFSNSPGLGGTPTAPTAAANTNTTQLATTAFVLSQIASSITGSGGANGSMTIPATGSPQGFYVVKWGFHTPGTNAGAGLETISVTGSGGAFPHHMYFASASGNRNSTVSTGVSTGYIPQASLSTTQFQAVLDDDASGNRSALWFAIGD